MVFIQYSSIGIPFESTLIETLSKKNNLLSIALDNSFLKPSNKLCSCGCNVNIIFLPLFPQKNNMLVN